MRVLRSFSMEQVNLRLHEHVCALLPADMCVHTSTEVGVDELYAQLECWTQYEFGVLGAATGNVGALTSGANCIRIRQLQFEDPQPHFMTRFMPYTSSTNVVSIKKRNVSVDARESFDVCDSASRSRLVQNTVNAAYFLQQRCGACGALVENTRKPHSCSFFCIAACQVAGTCTLENVVAFVEYNLLATTLRFSAGENSPCLSLHVITPSRLLSACFSVIDTLGAVLRLAMGVQYDGEPAIPCPSFLNVARLDIMSLSTVVEFYVLHAVPASLGERKRVAVGRILLGVGEYFLRTSVRKPMIVPFVCGDIAHVEVNQYYMQTPMRRIVQNLQKSRIRWSMGSDRAAYGPPAIHKDAEKDLLLAFLSPFSPCHADVAAAYGEWSDKHAANFVSGNIVHQLHKASSNRDLDMLLFAVRCFFHANQQVFYREQLLVVDPQALQPYGIRELELRFLIMLFRHGLPRKQIQFDPNDVCAVICPVAGTPKASPQCPRTACTRN